MAPSKSDTELHSSSELRNSSGKIEVSEHCSMLWTGLWVFPLQGGLSPHSILPPFELFEVMHEGSNSGLLCPGGEVLPHHPCWIVGLGGAELNMHPKVHDLRIRGKNSWHGFAFEAVLALSQ